MNYAVLYLETLLVVQQVVQRSAVGIFHHEANINSRSARPVQVHYVLVFDPGELPHFHRERLLLMIGGDGFHRNVLTPPGALVDDAETALAHDLQRQSVRQRDAQTRVRAIRQSM